MIDARGNVVKSIKWRSQGAIQTVLPPPAPASTLFGRIGNLMAVLVGLALIAIGIVLARRER